MFKTISNHKFVAIIRSYLKLFNLLPRKKSDITICKIKFSTVESIPLVRMERI
tara:strand:- start:311 stop:469 length:159 start_codon:yes stop_codon:yes gene_type:complete